ncbi:MAG TPA: hypothetical protein PLO23_10985 [Alphaproteobacteria bacterium]|mgnify:CR=1 FL=1|nr:hypothetical protein [Alphaproteobacteria bacterium]
MAYEPSEIMKGLMRAAFEQLEPQYAATEADIAEKDAGALETEESLKAELDTIQSLDGDETWMLVMN